MPDSDSITVSAVLPATPEQIFEAWMDGKAHGQMTGSAAKIQAKKGGTFSVWDGYITGKTLILTKGKRIVQSWRSSEFPEDAPDSRLEVALEKAARGTRITLKHTHIPRGQGANYRKGWKDWYFSPMKVFFSALAKAKG